MNLRYKDLETEPGVYIPNVGIDYPENDPYEHLYHPVYDRKVVVDEHYPYIDDSLKFRILNASM